MRGREWTRNLARALVALALVALAITPALGVPTYRFVDLGGMPLGSGAYGVTPTGFAAGYELVGLAQPHATLFENGQARDLGTLGGDASLANAVNGAGSVVGWARLADATRHAFLYQGGAMQDLGTLGGSISIAFAINDGGEVVGASYLAGDAVQVPFAWTAATGMQPVAVPNVFGGQALAVNAAGAIAGYVVDSTSSRAFAFQNGSATVLPDLGPPAKAYGISDNGLVVGYAITNSTFPKFHAVIWRGGVLHDFGALAGGHSVAYGVNRNGVVVGFSYLANDQMVATIFADDGILDLNSVLPQGSDWQLEMATSITNDGVISGIGVVGGAARAFALVPQEVQSGPWGLTFGMLRMRAYPTPMMAGGRLELELPASTHGRLSLFDVSGRRLAILADDDFPAGRVTVAVPGELVRRMTPGVYYARLETPRAVATSRVVVIR